MKKKSIDPNGRNPPFQVQRWVLGLQREVMFSALVRLSFMLGQGADTQAAQIQPYVAKFLHYCNAWHVGAQ